MIDRQSMPVELRKLQEQDDTEYYARLTPAERVGMMWQLALDAWAFKGEPVIEPRLPRHIGCLIRLKDKT